MDTLKKKINKLKRESKIITDFTMESFETNSQETPKSNFVRVRETHPDDYNENFCESENGELAPATRVSEKFLNCENNNCKNEGEFIVLSCNHIFHINCMNVEKCLKCNKDLNIEEKIYMNIKIKLQMKEANNRNERNIKILEMNLQKIQREILEQNNYKKQLSDNIGISKNIIKTIGLII